VLSFTCGGFSPFSGSPVVHWEPTTASKGVQCWGAGNVSDRSTLRLEDVPMTDKAGAPPSPRKYPIHGNLIPSRPLIVFSCMLFRRSLLTGLREEMSVLAANSFGPQFVYAN